MNSFKNEAKEKIASGKKLADEATKKAKEESDKSDRLSTMLHSMEEKLKKAEFDKSQQIGSLTENIGVHTQQLNKRVEECNRLRNDLAMAKTHNESLQETVEKLTSHVEEVEKKRDVEANTLRESLDRLQMTEEEMINAKQTADETANLLQELRNEVKDQKHSNKQLRQKLDKVLQEKKAIKQGVAIEGPKKFKEMASYFEEKLSENDIESVAEALADEGYRNNAIVGAVIALRNLYDKED